MRSSLVVRASDCQFTSCNGPGFDPSIRRHSGIWGATDEAVLNIVLNKREKIPQKIFNKKKTILFPPRSFVAVFWIRDGQKSGSGMNIPDPQHWLCRGSATFWWWLGSDFLILTPIRVQILIRIPYLRMMFIDTSDTGISPVTKLLSPVDREITGFDLHILSSFISNQLSMALTYCTVTRLSF